MLNAEIADGIGHISAQVAFQGGAVNRDKYLTKDSIGLQKLIVYIPCIHSDLCLIEEIRGHSPIDTTAQLALCKRMSLINFRIVSNEKQREEMIASKH